jgi:hypothetical protein
MAKTADQAHAIELAGPLFKAAYQKHVVIEFFQGFRVAFCGFWHGFGWPFSGSGKAWNQRCCKPKATWQEHCYFIALHSRTLFGNAAMLMQAGSLVEQLSNIAPSPARA